MGSAGPGVQLSLPLDEPINRSLPGLPGYSLREETEVEVRISGIDARRHLMELYHPLCAELGCASSAGLVTRRNFSEVWVAGVKVATQTPAIRSGRRIIFLTLDDPSGPIDVTVFEHVQPWCARTIFHSWLLLVRGELRKRGGASLIHETDPASIAVTVVAQEVFDLLELAAGRESGLHIQEAIERQRQRQGPPGPPSLQQQGLPGGLWHASGGSAGR